MGHQGNQHLQRRHLQGSSDGMGARWVVSWWLRMVNPDESMAIYGSWTFFFLMLNEIMKLFFFPDVFFGWWWWRMSLCIQQERMNLVDSSWNNVGKPIINLQFWRVCTTLSGDFCRMGYYWVDHIEQVPISGLFWGFSKRIWIKTGQMALNSY
jgi:hypothetical protein